MPIWKSRSSSELLATITSSPARSVTSTDRSNCPPATSTTPPGHSELPRPYHDFGLWHDPLEAGGRSFPRLGPDLRQPGLRQVRRGLWRQGIARRGDRGSVPVLQAAFARGGVHLVTVPIDYSENMRVLVDELKNRVPAPSAEHVMNIKAAVLNAMGAESPYAASKPLAIENSNSTRRGRARCWCGSKPRACATPTCR